MIGMNFLLSGVLVNGKERNVLFVLGSLMLVGGIISLQETGLGF
jgi:hypothetical protein